MKRFRTEEETAMTNRSHQGWTVFEWREKRNVIGYRATERARIDRKDGKQAK
jgi:hypothetical protein